MGHRVQTSAGWRFQRFGLRNIWKTGRPAVISGEDDQ